MNIDEIIGRIQAVRDNPQELTLATVDIVLAAHDAQLRAAFEAAAIPHWFSADILATLLQIDRITAEEYVDRLRQLPMVRAMPPVEAGTSMRPQGSLYAPNWPERMRTGFAHSPYGQPNVFRPANLTTE